MNKPVTIKDIAREVGVGNTAVSAVLGHKPSSHVRVSEATRARILEAARVMKYRRNGLARSFRNQKTDVLGIYTTQGYLSPHVVFSSQIIGGLHRGCYEHSKDLLLHSIISTRPAEEVYAELGDGRVDGLVLYASPTDPVVRLLADSTLPVVAIVDAVAGLPSVVADDDGGSRRLAAYLAGRGHLRVLYISGSDTIVSAFRRRQGFQEAAASLGMEVTEFQPSIHHEQLTEVDLEWLDLPRSERPTAVVCWNDMTAYNLLERCHQRGLRIPEDIAVAGFDGVPFSVPTQWQLTTLRAPWVEVAEAAIGSLMRRLNGEEIPMETILPVEFILGETA
jgi:DNA-binding LacI/PurR family transcriptional regulator